MTPTPPNPAAAQVERIVKECAKFCILNTALWVNDDSETIAPHNGVELRIHRAIADAIAALQVREALAFSISCIKSGESWSETCEREIKGTLANLDAVMGKEP